MMYEVQLYDYCDKKDTFLPVGNKIPFLTLLQARQATRKAYQETENYYLITSLEDKQFQEWMDEIAI